MELSMLAVCAGYLLLVLFTPIAAQNIGSQLNVKVAILQNFPTGLFGVNITHEGDSKLTENPLFFRFCLVHPVKGGHYESTNTSEATFSVEHINGCYHTMSVDNENGMENGDVKELQIPVRNWMVAYTDFWPNWYLTTGSGEHQLVTSTATENLKSFVGPFDTSNKYLRYSWDEVLPFNVVDRYERYNYADLIDAEDEDVKQRVVPAVKELSLTGEFVTVDGEQELGIPGSNRKVSVPGGITVTFETTDGGDDPEEYAIEIASDKVVIRGQEKGMMMATATLKQLQQHNGGTKLPLGTMKDKPRFGYRGFMLDIARNFRSVEEIKHYLKVMQRYKLNILHLHLTDDEGWRLEIEGLEELSTFANTVSFNPSEGLFPMYGHKIDEIPQYLTKQQYIDLLQYAQELGITVLPEVDIPGHSRVAVKAMSHRYEKAMKQNITVAEEDDYRLTEDDDFSEYSSAQYYNDSAMNPCLNSTFNFIEKVVAVIVSYHVEANVPLKMIHLGGDEIPLGSTQNSTACYEVLIGDENSRASDNERNFFRRVGEIAAKYSLDLAFWEDGLLIGGKPIDRTVFPDTIDVYGFWWQAVWEWGVTARPYSLANAGYKLVQTPSLAYYFDHAQEPHPEERGYYWSTRYITSREAFQWRPDDMYKNIETYHRLASMKPNTGLCDAPGACPKLERPENIVGLQGNLFAETVRLKEHADDMVFPRLMFMAERAWHKAEWEDNSDTFDQDLAGLATVIGQYELDALFQDGNNHHVAPPGLNILKINGTVTLMGVRTEFHRQVVEWKRVGSGDQWEQYNKDSPPSLEQATEFRTRSSITDGVSFSQMVDSSFELPPAKPTPDPSTSETTTNSGQHIQPFAVFTVCCAIVLSTML